MATTLTTRQQNFIRKNRLRMSATAMAIRFGIDDGIVGRWMRKNGLSAPYELQLKFRAQAMTGRTTATPKEDRFIKKNYLKMPVKVLAERLGNKRTGTFVSKRLSQLGLVIPRKIIEQRKRDSRIKPGNIPANKGKKQKDYMSREQIEKTKATRFFKGHLPHNSVGVKDGDIRIRHYHKNRGGKAYKYVRIALGKWLPLHQHLWEKKRGKVPEGHCLWFRDGDTMNVRLKNLELITRKENYRRNSASTNLTDSVVAFYIAGRTNPELKEELLENHKGIIDAKRQQIILQRTIKKAINAKR
jgi:hypothetical protein